MATETVPKKLKNSYALGHRTKTRSSVVCKRCSKWILYGEVMEYSLAGWVHPTVDDCAAALPSNRNKQWSTDEERDSQDFYERMQRLAMAVRRQKWTFAKTMPDSPHYWVIRSTWIGDGFDELVEASRLDGQLIQYGKTDYYIVNLNEHRHWVCDARHSPPQAVELINRAVRLRYEPEPEAWHDPSWAWWSEPVERAVIAHMTDTTARVLDVGGTCPSVSTIAGPGYRAIGSPGDMTRVLNEPAMATARTMHVEVEHFYPTDPEPFDMAVCAFGGGARLSAREILRLQYMTKPGGKVILHIGSKTHVMTEVGHYLTQRGTSQTVAHMTQWVLDGLWRTPSFA